MTRKAHVWTGVTLLAVIAINYVLIAYPLARKSISLRDKMRSVVIAVSPDDEYFLEIYRKEKLAVDKKIVLANAAGASLVILIFSWTIFGLIVPGKKNK